MSEEQKHGWYSASMEAVVRRGPMGNGGHGPSIWETADKKEVVVTCVTNSATDSGTNWNDVVYVGPVDKRLRTQT